MRTTTWKNIVAMMLAFALLVSLVPTQVYAMAGEAMVAEQADGSQTPTLQVTPSNLSTTEVLPQPTENPQVYTNSYVVKEDESRRGETYKEYVMNNGLRLATVYPSAIHYEDDGEWKDIDNTLVAAVAEGKAVYQNAAGAWNVRFPRSLSGSDMIGITKDGHTVQFGMAGEMRSTGDLVVASVDAIGRDEAANTLAINNAKTAIAQIQQINMTAAREAAEHPETVLEKLNSRLTYANVYPNTNVVYDLQGNRLKESVVLQRYDASLWGYRYTLDTGDLVPVLQENQQIDLCDPETNEPILTMPAPYMLDSNGEVSYDVEVSLTRNGSEYLLSYYLPRAWLAEADRTWPVILDPIVEMVGTAKKVKDCTVSENLAESYTDYTLECGHKSNRGVMRFFLQYTELPTMASGDVIVDATISLLKPADGDVDCVIEVHKVKEAWTSQTVSWSNMPEYDPIVEDYVICKLADRYEWNITDVVRGWYTNENEGILFKASDEVENAKNGNWKQFYSSDLAPSAQNGPLLTITYQNHNGLEDYWSYSSSSASRAGTGYVNLFTGNLVWVRGDLGFDGNRMPVSISHVYNSNDSQSNQFGMGYGWRTNYNQTITVSDDGLYVWEDGDGTRHYFITNEDGSITDLDGMRLSLTVTETGYILTDQYGNISEFTGGKLTRMANNLIGSSVTQSEIIISYDTETGFITEIIDAVGRKYQFSYELGMLNRISYKGTGNTELAVVFYAYNNGNLVQVKDNDDKTTAYTYDEHLLIKAEDITDYYLTYMYTTGSVKRVAEVREFHGAIHGNSLSLEYGSHNTEVTDHKENLTRYQFNDWGNLIATHDSEGHTQYTKYALNNTNDPISITAQPHQVLENSGPKGTAINHFADSSFEAGGIWSGYSGVYISRLSTEEAYLGSKSMKMTNADHVSGSSVIGPYFDIGAGETYTFSAYLLPDPGAQVTVDFVTSGYVPLASTKLEETVDDWVRLQVSYTNEDTSYKRVHPHISVSTGTLYVDCVQLEKAEAASNYNLLENGEFKITQSEGAAYLAGWNTTDGCTSDDHYYGSPAANTALEAGIFLMTGDTALEKYISQTVTMSGEAGDAFVLAAWARANAAPLRENRAFGLKLIFHNTDDTQTEYYTSFDPDIPFQYWQYTALTAIATTAYNALTVQVLYSHQINTAYFDGIQLYADRIGTSYIYDENKNVVSETNILGQTTTYMYYDNGIDLKSVDAPVGTDASYEYDDFHNVTQMKETAEDESGNLHTTTYDYTYDVYGNITSVTVTQGTSKQKNVTAYSTNGNYMTATTDNNGDTTTYGFDTETGVLLWVQYPEDTEATRTYYEYDEIYRLKKTSTTTDQNKEMSAEYTYVNDLLRTLETNSTTYSFSYGNFDLRTSVAVGNRRLVQYSYTEDNNHYLTGLSYANQDRVAYSYDNLGRVITEEYYENGAAEPSRIISYTYDNAGTLAITEDSATGIISACYYDFAGRVSKLVRTDEESFYHVFMYGYDENGNVSAMLEYVNGENFLTKYSYDYKNRIQSVETDSTKKEYTYNSLNQVTRENVDSVSGETVKSVYRNYYFYTNATVSGQVVASNQVVRMDTESNYYQKVNLYQYDGNGNIISVGDGSKTTTYVYDSANQLIRENNQAAGHTWVWIYDDAGNILSKQEYGYTTGELGTPVRTISYTYGDAAWGDLLTAYNGRSITYDQIGNPLNDGTWTYTWQQGRQLATMSSGNITWTYTYDANGMRTSRTSNGTTAYTYVYNGSQLSMMTCNGNVLYFAYDAAGRPMTVNYNGNTYYYVTNLQGDVLAILNELGQMMVNYTYDAWGRSLGTGGALANSLGLYNPLRYRGYVYDQETGLYYVSSRYYDPEIGRWINADGQLTTGSDLTGLNLFAYCGNNPVNRIDPTGEAWWHWALGAAVVAVAAVATVVTCGGFAAAATAVCMVGSGVAAATTASTVAAGAFIGSATVYGMAVLSAASTSNSVQEFNDQGNWGTVAATAFGGLTGGYDGYTMSKAQTPQTTTTGNTKPTVRHTSGVGNPNNNINPGGSYTKLDNNGNLYSYTQFDNLGRQTMRMDFQGRPHAGVLPHIHLYTYPQQGGRVEYIFDLNWHLIN